MQWPNHKFGERAVFQVAGALSPHVLSVQNVYGTGRKGMPRAGQKSQLLVVLLTHKIIAHPSPREAWFSDVSVQNSQFSTNNSNFYHTSLWHSSHFQ